MKNKIFSRLFMAALSMVIVVGASSSVNGVATIVINNINAPGVGFNDTTPAVPVGGNAGTTLGQQRLIAFTHAANRWGTTITSTVPITINAQFSALSCTATGATLGSAGATTVFREFPNAPFSGTWYSQALANKLFGSDLSPANADINANFNVNLGNPGCLTGTFFYLGLDGNHGANIDFVTVLLHEMAHGLGFQTFTSGTTGNYLGSPQFPTIYDRFLIDDTSGKSWISMTPTERVASAKNSRKLAWSGPRVSSDVPSVLSPGTPLLKIISPVGIAGNYDVGNASFGPALTAGGLTGNVVQALDPADGAGPSTTDGCTALTNSGAVFGNIAIIDRGTCGFVIKVKNAQNAGAIAVIIADNVAGSPPAGLGGADPTITIPSVRVTQADGTAIKAQLGVGVNASLKLDTAVRAGADPFGKALMFTPNPFQSGSSVSHWDTIATPNQLMEPSINGDLTQSVVPPQDLTYSQLRDIGWEPSSLPSSITKTSGDNQSVGINSPYGIPISVTVSPAVAGVTVTWTSVPSVGGSFGTFPSTNSKMETSVTDAGGVALAPALYANGVVGTFTLNATAPGAGSVSFTENITTLATVTTLDQPANTQYSDKVTLRATVSSTAGSDLGGSVEFKINGASVGSSAIDASGVATLETQILLAPASYPVVAIYTNPNPVILSSSDSKSLLVTREDASVDFPASNPFSVKVNSPGGTAGPITICADITEVSDGSAGDTTNATATFSITPVAGGSSPSPGVVIYSGGGVGGTRRACITISNVAVDVYDITVTVGGYYQGTNGTVLAIYDPSLGFVTGGGKIFNNGNMANFGVNVKYLKNGKVQGAGLYIEHRPTGLVKVKSNSMQSLSIVNGTAVIIAKATVNGVGNYGIRMTVVDNGEPGSSDQLGLTTTSPLGAGVPDLTFGLTTLAGGNIQVPQNPR